MLVCSCLFKYWVMKIMKSHSNLEIQHAFFKQMKPCPLVLSWNIFTWTHIEHLNLAISDMAMAQTKVWQILIHSPNYQFKHQTFSSIELRNVAIKKGNPTIKKRELKDWKGMSESDSGIYLYMKSNEDTPEDWQIIPVLKVMWPRRHTQQP